MNPEYYDVIMNKGRPIPGSSLTSDPDNPAPYERPPEYTNIHKASEWIFGQLIQEENYEQLIQVLLEDMPVMDVTQVLLFRGYMEGKWDGNLMMLLVEPTAYIVLALAERAGVDPVIFRGEEEDEASEEFFNGVKLNEEKLENIKKYKELGVQIPFLSEEEKLKMDKLPTADEMGMEETGAGAEEQAPSLLAQPQEEEVIENE